MGLLGGSCQTIGYSYFLDMAYVISDRIDSVIGFYMAENKNWSGIVNTNGGTFTCWTGKKAEIGDTKGRESTVTVYLGTQTTSDPYLTQVTGKNLIYKDVSYLVFPQSYIGDNVQTVPIYGLLVVRYNIDSASSLTNYNTHKNIIGTRNIGVVESSQSSGNSITLFDNLTYTPYEVSSTSSYTTSTTPSGETILQITGANPAYVIYDILVALLSVPEDKVDKESFEAAAETLFNEKIGLNIVISSSKKGIEWIEEILRYINGIVFSNSNTGQFTISLFRDDYDVDDLYIFDDDNSSEAELTRPSRADLPNIFTFKYANISGNETPKKDSVLLTNQANLVLAGYPKNIDIDLTLLNTDEAFQLLVNYYFLKYSTPLATLKLKINIVEAQLLQVGATFIYNSRGLFPNSGIVFRVLKVTGDSIIDPYLTIEAIEDIFKIATPIQLPSGGTTIAPPNYTLENPPTLVKVFDSSPEFSNTKSILVATIISSGSNEIIRNIAVEVDGDPQVDTKPWAYGKVLSISSNLFNTIDRGLILIVEDTYNSLGDIELTEEFFQRGSLIGFWDNEVIFFKKCSRVSDTTFEISGIMRNVLNAPVTYSDINASYKPFTSNTTTNGVITSSTKYNTITEPYKAFNGVIGSGWITSGGVNGEWIQQVFSTPKTLTSYNFMPWSIDNFPHRSPKSWKLEGSNDGVSWTLLDTRDNFTTYTIWTYTSSFYFTNDTAYTHYRFTFFSNVSNVSYLGLCGIKLNNKSIIHQSGGDLFITNNEINPISISSNTPQIEVYTQNINSDSPSIITNYNYKFTIETPYAPVNVQVVPMGGYATIVWTPSVRNNGANYESCDTIAAGQNEGMVEGVFNIYKDGVFYTSGVTSSFETVLTYNVIEAGTWGVSTKVGAYESSINSVVVTAEDFL